MVEQQGYRKVVDASFMIGFLFSVDANMDDVAKYFQALRRAQRDIDLDLGRYKHYYLRELPERYHSLVDVQAFGPASASYSSPTPATCTTRPTVGWWSDSYLTARPHRLPNTAWRWPASLSPLTLPRRLVNGHDGR